MWGFLEFGTAHPKDYSDGNTKFSHLEEMEERTQPSALGRN